MLEWAISNFLSSRKKHIDWVRLSATDKWHSENITEVNTLGTEIIINYSNNKNKLPKFFRRTQLTYAYLSIQKQTGNYYSKYALDVLRHKLSLSHTYSFNNKVNFSWYLLYHERSGTYTEYPSGNEITYKPYITVDASINYQWKNINFFINGSNLFNSYYYDIANIPMPGRWVRSGFSLTL